MLLQLVADWKDVVRLASTGGRRTVIINTRVDYETHLIDGAHSVAQHTCI